MVIAVDSSKVAPKVTTQMRTDTIVNKGSYVLFTVGINNCFPTPTFTWFKVGATTSVGSGQIWTKTVNSASDSGNYYVVLLSSAGTDTSKFGHITYADRPPILGTLTDKMVPENSALSFAVTATDPDGDAITITATNGDGSALSTIGATFTSGTFSWTPNYSQSGVYSIKFTASDGTLTTSGTMSISVTNVDRPPVIATIAPITVSPGTPVTLTVSVSDPDGTTPVLGYTGLLPVNATFNSSTGAFAWTPLAYQYGLISVVFTASDGVVTVNDTVRITVNKATIGQTYGGGYLVSISSDGRHGLIAASTDLHVGADTVFFQYGCEGTYVGALYTDTVYGHGISNQNNILAGCNSTTCASYYCSKLTTGGYSDWIVPTQDEMQIVYNSHTLINWTSTEYDYFWTSSELSSNTASDFSVIRFLEQDKYMLYKVRPVREF